MNTTQYSQSVEIRTETIDGLSVEHSIPTTRLFKFIVVLVHGMWGTGATMHPIMKALGLLGYECYAPTLRGHGNSMRVDDLGKVSILDYVIDINIFIRGLDQQQVVLIGHSMGEIIASQVTSQNNTRVIAHIGITSAPPRGVLMGLRTLIRMPKYLWKIITRKPMMLSAADSKAVLFNRVSPKMTDGLVKSMVAESGTAALELTIGLHKMLRLNCPALIIGGSFDKITPHQKIVAKRLGAEFKELLCGHMVMNDPNMGSLIQTIHSWLKLRLGEAFAL